MTAIHRSIFLHLFWVWFSVSLVGGGLLFFLEIKRIDSSMVALAVNEADSFSYQLHLPPDHPGLFKREEWRTQALSAAQKHYVAIAIYDQLGNQRTKIVNPRYADLEKTMRPHDRHFPLDGLRHVEKTTVGDQVIVQLLIPISQKQTPFTGYLSGSFVIDQATIDRLHSNLVWNLINLLLAISITTVALYPIIISLNKDVIKFSTQLLHANIEMAAALGAAIAIRDSKTHAHNYRVTLYAIHLGERVGLEPEAMRRLILGAFLHDIGKIGISDTILLKPGRLEEDEYMIMRTHVELGLQIIRISEWLSAGQEVVANHHERFDGHGYPRGLCGTEIPILARIFAIVDVFDALSSERPYKKAFPLNQCMEILNKEAGVHFDPELVEIFTEEVAPIYNRLFAMDESAMINWLEDKSLFYFLPHSLKGLKKEIFTPYNKKMPLE